MPKMKFTDNFDWQVRQNVWIAYKAGSVYNVTRRCAEAAKAAGAAKRVPAPRRKPRKADAG